MWIMISQLAFLATLVYILKVFNDDIVTLHAEVVDQKLTIMACEDAIETLNATIVKHETDLSAAFDEIGELWAANNDSIKRDKVVQDKLLAQGDGKVKWFTKRMNK